jgi:murein DD-endopeptidase MepM/ murein hydrolase activator NlpD
VTDDGRFCDELPRTPGVPLSCDAVWVRDSLLRRGLLLFLPLVPLLSGPPLAQPAPSQDALTVTFTQPGPGVVLRPGDVVRVEVRSAKALGRIEGTAFQRPIALMIASDARTATGLIGMAAETAAGAYHVDIHGETATGERVDASRTLTVAKALFRSQRLRVDPRFVEPPREALPRIANERERIGALSHAIDRERPWQAPFGPPLDTPVSEPFGVRRTFNGELASQHRGVDLKGAMGTPIAAPGAGRVVLADDLYYTGNTVVIDHGYGVVSLLAHMSRVLVKEGQLVDPGAIVGEVGATGRVTGPHLHWSAWVGGVSIDPLSLVSAIDAASRPAKARAEKQKRNFRSPARQP